MMLETNATAMLWLSESDLRTPALLDLVYTLLHPVIGNMLLDLSLLCPYGCITHSNVLLFPCGVYMCCACTDSHWGTDDMNKCSLKSADGSSNLWNSVNPYGDPTYRWWQRKNPIRIPSQYFRLTPNHSYLKPTDLVHHLIQQVRLF